MKLTHPITFAASDDDVNLLGVIHHDEAITLRGLQTDLARLRALTPLVRLSVREPAGIAFALPVIGYGPNTEEEAALRSFDFDFATSESPEDVPTVLYLTSPERSRTLTSGQDACRLILEPDQPITAGTLKAFIDGLGMSYLTLESEGPYLSLRDGQGGMLSSFRRRHMEEYIQPRYQPCGMQLVCEKNEADQICAVRIEVTADGGFNLRAAHQVPSIARVSSKNGMAFGWMEPVAAANLLWDYLGEGRLWTTAIMFAKALGFHPENLGELELIIDDQRTWCYQPDAISDRR